MLRLRQHCSDVLCVHMNIKNVCIYENTNKCVNNTTNNKLIKVQIIYNIFNMYIKTPQVISGLS